MLPNSPSISSILALFRSKLYDSNSTMIDLTRSDYMTDSPRSYRSFQKSAFFDNVLLPFLFVCETFASIPLSLYLPPFRSESLSHFLSFSLVLNPELTARKKRRDAEYKAKVRNEWRDINLRRLALRSPRTWYGTIVPRVSSCVQHRFDLSISPFLSRSLMCARFFFACL